MTDPTAKEALRALQTYLPIGYDIGDDATVELAVELTHKDVEIERLRTALKIIYDEINRPNSRPVHWKRCVCVAYNNAMKPTTEKAPVS